MEITDAGLARCATAEGHDLIRSLYARTTAEGLSLDRRWGVLTVAVALLLAGDEGGACAFQDDRELADFINLNTQVIHSILRAALPQAQVFESHHRTPSS